MSDEAEFIGQMVFNQVDIGEVDRLDVVVSAVFKSSAFSEMLKASTDINSNFQKSANIFNGSKPWTDFTVESAVGIGFSISPLTRSSVGNTFGISSSSLNSPIAKFGSYSFMSVESVISQSAEKGLRNEFKK